jgi:serine/threonine protein kinase
MKPENILIGAGKKVNTINLIDFGLSKRYISPCTGKHIPITQKPGCVGTFRFLSYNAHQGYEHSRRDDLESLGNILIHFMLKGKLPWAAFQHPDDELLAQGKVPEANKVEY